MRHLVVRSFLLLAVFMLGVTASYSQCETGIANMTMYYPYNGTVTQGQSIYSYWYIPTTKSGSTISVQWSPDKVNWTTVASGYSCTSGYHYEYVTAPYDFEETTTCYARIVEVTGNSCYYRPAYSYSYRLNRPFTVKRACVVPPITKQPSNQVVCINQPVTLEVGAPKGKHYTYKWTKNGFPYSTDGPNLEFASIALKDNGTYQLEVSDDCGKKALTQQATITVYEPAIITKHPTNTTICKGTSGALSVECTGNANTYQWYKNGEAISGETTTTLSFSSALPADEGQYHMVATGGCGAPATSDTVTITVPPKPEIVEQPQASAVCPGDVLHFSIRATGPGLSYQWYKDDQEIIGATLPTLDIPGATADNNGFYQCVVDIPGIKDATGCDAVKKSDRVFAYIYTAPIITQQPEDVQVCLGKSMELSVGADGTGLTYQWFFNGTSIPDATGYSLVIDNAAEAQDGSYYAQVNGVCGLSTTTNTIQVSVFAMPTITLQPEAVKAMVGDPIELTVNASDALTITWLHNEKEIVSDPTSTLTIPNATLEDNGYYRAVVKNVCGGATSRSVRVVVIDPRSLEPRLTTQSTTLDVQEVPFGYSDDQTFTEVITNTGIVPVTISGLTISGPDASAFTAVESTAPTTLQPGEGLSVIVAFTPVHTGASSASLTIESDATNGPHTIALAGTGVVRYTVDNDLNFGVVDKSSTTTKCFQINNTSATDITIDNVELTGTNPAEFTISTTMPLSVLAGSASELCLQFLPTDVGNYSASVSFKSANGGNVESTASGTCEIASTVTLDALQAGIVVYPNPATESLSINTGSVVPTSVKLLTTAGQEIISLPPQQQATWNLTNLNGLAVPSGTYILLLTDSSHQYRMMIQVLR